MNLSSLCRPNIEEEIKKIVVTNPKYVELYDLTPNQILSKIKTDPNLAELSEEINDFINDQGN